VRSAPLASRQPGRRQIFAIAQVRPGLRPADRWSIDCMISPATNMIQPHESLASIVSRHQEYALVLRRHGIDYRRRPDRPLVVACRERGVDLGGLVRQLEHVAVETPGGNRHSPSEMSNAALLEHIVGGGHERVRRSLPIVRGLAARLAQRHGADKPQFRELALAVLDLDDIVSLHFEEEEQCLFVAIKLVAPDSTFMRTSLAKLEEEHVVIGARLAQVRVSSDDYQVPDWACATHRTLVRELQGIDRELRRHIELEEQVLLPRFLPRPSAPAR
jgi:regulator of cell morphogenesis and NO signaling